MMPAHPDLGRFVAAQDPLLPQIEKELAAGRKQTHWMWFVFPQIAGLGHSPMAERYAIADLDEARRYLAHPLLGERLRRHVAMVLAHHDMSAHRIFGSPDDLKFRSCLTLFRAATHDPRDRQLLTDALARFYGGEEDARTRALLTSGQT